MPLLWVIMLHSDNNLVRQVLLLVPVYRQFGQLAEGHMAIKWSQHFDPDPVEPAVPSCCPCVLGWAMPWHSQPQGWHPATSLEEPATPLQSEVLGTHPGSAISDGEINVHLTVPGHHQVFICKRTWISLPYKPGLESCLTKH